MKLILTKIKMILSELKRVNTRTQEETIYISELIQYLELSQKKLEKLIDFRENYLGK